MQIYPKLTGSRPGGSMLSAAALGIAVAAVSGSTVSITSPPTTGNAGSVLSVAGTVGPSATPVQVGLSTTNTVAPTTWTNATVTGTGWTASLTPSIAGTFYIWAEQTASIGVRAISAAVTVGASLGNVSPGGSALTYSLISGSGNATLTGVTASTTTSGSAPAVDWTSTIVHASTDVSPNITLSAIGSIASGKFWFDTTNTGVTPGTVGNALFNGNLAAFYPFAAGFGAPTCAPAAPATAGTYYGKYAFYNSSSVLLGVFTTSAITVT